MYFIVLINILFSSWIILCHKQISQNSFLWAFSVESTQTFTLISHNQFHSQASTNLLQKYEFVIMVDNTNAVLITISFSGHVQS